MNWKRVDKYAERTACGEYSVAAIGFDNGQRGFFEVWKGRTLVATKLPSAAAAREVAEKHHADQNS